MQEYTKENINETIAEYVASCFCDYYELPLFKEKFPDLKINDEVLGVIVPDDFIWFNSWGEFYGLPITVEKSQTNFRYEDGMEITDVYIVKATSALRGS